MITQVQYGTLLNYSPRGQSALSHASRDVKSAIKAGRPSHLELAMVRLHEQVSAQLMPMLSHDTILVPVPKSSPRIANSLWPSLEICNSLIHAGFGGSIEELIERVYKVKSASSGYSGANRPSIPDHMASMSVSNILVQPTNITLVDDVLTMGRTTMACAQLLNDVWPNAQIRVFALIRTQGFLPDVISILDPSLGTITLNPVTMDCSRTP